MGWAAGSSTASWRTPACSTGWQDCDAVEEWELRHRDLQHRDLQGHHDWVKRL